MRDRTFAYKHFAFVGYYLTHLYTLMYQIYIVN